MKHQLVLVVCLVSMVSCMVDSDDKFIKKYGMMKIYESCFGQAVVRQLRKEMKAACAKCASIPPPMPSTTPTPSTEEPPQSDVQPTLDVEKLHQAIMAYRPNSPPPQFRPPTGGGQQFAPGQNFYSPMAFSNPGFQNYPFLYPGYQQIPFSPYGNFPVVGQQFYGASNRMSRDMDLRELLEVITSKMHDKVRNVTCVLQEIGYLNENLELNFERISERLGNLQVDEELKRDMQDGVMFCKQFSQCVPEPKKRKSPIPKELIRQTYFFKCYKQKKLEACVMKDVRDKFYSQSDDDEFEGDDVELNRAGRKSKMSEEFKEADVDEMADNVYNFLYSSDNSFDLDGVM